MSLAGSIGSGWRALALGPKRWAVLAAIAVALAALGLGIYVGKRHEPAQGAEALFALSFPDPQGKSESLAQWRGKVLVVNFWATWCAPCREEIPQFIKLQNELGTRGLQFVGIAADDAGKVEQYVEEVKLNYPALIGGFGAIELSKIYGNRLQALPFTIVIDRTGHIIHTQLGPLSAAKLLAIANHAL